MKRIFLIGVWSLFLTLLAGAEAADQRQQPAGEGRGVAVPILVYHRFGPTAADQMTVPTAVFDAQLRHLRDQGYTVIPLRQLIDHLRGEGPPPPPQAVVITADDGHRSVYTDLFPLAKSYRFPVTLFIYPSAISNAAYALTWEQLREMRDSGLFDVQSHTYWHPNFRKERQRLSAGEYAQLVKTQLGKAREKIAGEMGGEVDLLAWPFGIHDPWLMGQARETGYQAAFTIEPYAASSADDLLALPRFMVTATTGVQGFIRILPHAAGER